MALVDKFYREHLLSGTIVSAQIKEQVSNVQVSNVLLACSCAKKKKKKKKKKCQYNGQTYNRCAQFVDD